MSQLPIYFWNIYRVGIDTETNNINSKRVRFLIWRRMLRTEEVTDSTKSLYDTTENRGLESTTGGNEA